MRDKKKILQVVWNIILIGISIYTVIPLLKLGVYDHPCADDFNYSIQTHQVWQETHSVGRLIKAAWSTSVQFWHTWQGLYASAFVLALQPAIFGETYYALTVWILIVTIYVSNLIFTEYVLHHKFHTSVLDAMAMAFVMSMVMVQWIPSAVQGLYWYNGAMNYVFFYGVFLLLVVGQISLYTLCTWWQYALKVLATFSLGVMLMGGNHVTALCGLMLGILACIPALFQKKRQTVIASLIVFGGMLAGFLINICSPGTKVRQACFTDRPGFFGTIIIAVKTGILSINEWLGLGLLICAIAMLPFVAATAKRIFIEKKFGFCYPLAVFVASVAWICLMFCPPIYATGTTGDGRLKNVIYFTFVVLVFVNEFYLCGWLCTKTDIESMAQNGEQTFVGMLTAKVVLAAGLIILCMFDSTACVARGEVIYEQAQGYSAQVDQRVKIYLDSEGQDVVVPAFTETPELLFFSDITDNASDWKNVSLRDYYRLNSVVVGW